jgi:hypothetical protein
MTDEEIKRYNELSESTEPLGFYERAELTDLCTRMLYSLWRNDPLVAEAFAKLRNR